MKINMLVGLLLLCCVVKAQDSTADKSICIPFDVAKKVQLELIEKDSLTTMFNYVLDELTIVRGNNLSKDSLLSQYSKKFLDMTTEINNEKALKLTYKGIAEDCKSDYDKLGRKYALFQKKSTFGTILLAGISLGLASIILIKL